jgi:retron-type reverse transcriptase
VDAVKEVHRLIGRGYTDVVDADLSKYFDTIPHSELMKSLARRVADGQVLRLIKLWLKAERYRMAQATALILDSTDSNLPRVSY